MIRLGGLLVFVAALSAPHIADACSAPRCVGGSIAPSDHFAVPANLPGLVWHPLIDQSAPDGSADPSKLTIKRDDGTTVAFTAHALTGTDMLLVPDAPLSAGQTYYIDDATTCGDTRSQVDGSAFEVRAAAPLPTTLGTLAASDRGFLLANVPTPTGSCTAEVQVATRTMWLKLEIGTDAWQDLLQYRAFVDDQPWQRKVYSVFGPPGTGEAAANVPVYRTCVSPDPDADPGLAAGTHTVRIEATLPGSSVHLVSNTVTFDLDCDPTPPPAKDDGGCNSGGASSLGAAFLALGALLVRRRRAA